MRLNTQAAWILRVAVPVLALGLAAPSFAQQTLGNINGTVTDISGAVVAGAKVQITGENNGITLTTVSGKNGRYQFQNLPVGLYTLLFTETGFEVERVPSVPVQEDRTGTINAALRPGSEGTTIDVTEHPLLNETDATNGYVLDAQTIQETPLATGSFTRLATLAPGVSGELIAGIGTATGLGNQPIWANGQRDTSNGLNVDGVDVTNLFNGKSSSQDQSQRYNFNIGSGQESSVAGQSVTNTSVYGSNGNSLATPPPDFIQQLTVNTSEYDASEGNHSGAQINVNTMSGSNVLHGNGYATRATNFANAAPYFNKQSGPAYLNSIPQSFVIPQLHRDLQEQALLRAGLPVRTRCRCTEGLFFIFGSLRSGHGSIRYQGRGPLQRQAGGWSDRRPLDNRNPECGHRLQLRHTGKRRYDDDRADHDRPGRAGAVDREAEQWPIPDPLRAEHLQHRVGGQQCVHQQRRIVSLLRRTRRFGLQRDPARPPFRQVLLPVRSQPEPLRERQHVRLPCTGGQWCAGHLARQHDYAGLAHQLGATHRAFAAKELLDLQASDREWHLWHRFPRRNQHPGHLAGRLLLVERQQRHDRPQ
jgi:hypothetical protein